MKFPIRSGISQRCLLLPLVLEVGPGKVGKEMKQKSSTFERKEEIKLYIFANDMTLSRKVK